jgi:hypothetical protein
MRRSILAHVIEILRQTATIPGREILLQRRDLAHDGVEQAARLLTTRSALRVGAAVAEQFLEHQPRVVLHRQRRRRRLPRDRVAIGAAERRLAREHGFFDRQLERRQRRVLTELLRDDLIDRYAEMRLRAPLRHRACEEHGGGARVIGARGDVGATGASDERMRETADDVETIAIGLEWLQDFGEREASSLRRRRPLVHRRAVRHVDAGEPRLR